MICFIKCAKITLYGVAVFSALWRYINFVLLLLLLLLCIWLAVCNESAWSQKWNLAFNG